MYDYSTRKEKSKSFGSPRFARRLIGIQFWGQNELAVSQNMVRADVFNKYCHFGKICGEHTDTASGVAAEIRIAQEENKPYFLLWGRSDKTCVKPKNAKDEDKIYKWTWDNLKIFLTDKDKSYERFVCEK